MKLGLISAWIAATFLGTWAILAACTGGAPGSSTPSPPPTAGDDTCILPLVARDVAGGLRWSDCLGDATRACGVSQATVQAVWTAHVTAEVLEGFVPRMPVLDGG